VRVTVDELPDEAKKLEMAWGLYDRFHEFWYGLRQSACGRVQQANDLGPMGRCSSHSGQSGRGDRASLRGPPAAPWLATRVRSPNFVQPAERMRRGASPLIDCCRTQIPASRHSQTYVLRSHRRGQGQRRGTQLGGILVVDDGGQRINAEQPLSRSCDPWLLPIVSIAGRTGLGCTRTTRDLPSSAHKPLNARKPA